MISFSNKNIAVASVADMAAIAILLNSAYRGESSKQGWTSEANIIAGDVRTDENSLLELIKQPNCVMVKYTDDEQQIIGCVNLQQQDNKIYLGMLSVRPQLQGGGVGKQLLNAAEEYARHLQCLTVYMTVVTVRTELIDWYKRYSYKDTGERKSFTEDGLTGKHLQTLEFMVMEKSILK